MHAALVVMVGMSLGVDVGWQSLDDGGVEYIIQLEPQALELLRNGEELRSDIPPFLRDQMRSYRIKVGTGELPRDMQIQQPSPAAPQNGATNERALPASKASQDDDQPQQPSDAAAASPGQPGEDAFPQTVRTARPPRNEPRYPADTPLERRDMPAPSDVDPVAEQPPRMIEPDPSTTALVNHESAYREGADHSGSAGPSADKSAEPATSNDAPAGRWWPLTGAMLLLFVSMGGNAYLGMQWWSARLRCQELLRQIRSPRQGGRGVATSEGQSSDERDEDQDVQIVHERSRR